MVLDYIWQFLMDLWESGKLLVVLMGVLVVFGGYYILVLVNYIIVEFSIIMGSIGVVSVILQFQDLFKEKIGVYFDSVKIGLFVIGINLVFDMIEGEKCFLCVCIDQMYEIFFSWVSVGRDMLVLVVDSIV